MCLTAPERFSLMNSLPFRVQAPDSFLFLTLLRAAVKRSLTYLLRCSPIKILSLALRSFFFCINTIALSLRLVKCTIIGRCSALADVLRRRWPTEISEISSVAALSALVLSPLRAQQFGILYPTVCVIQLLALISFDVT